MVLCTKIFWITCWYFISLGGLHILYYDIEIFVYLVLSVSNICVVEIEINIITV